MSYVYLTLNLQNSFKNLLLSVNTFGMNDQTLNEWQNVIDSIIKKERFYKLENVIISLCIANDTDWIFTILTKNIHELSQRPVAQGRAAQNI